MARTAQQAVSIVFRELTNHNWNLHNSISSWRIMFFFTFRQSSWVLVCWFRSCRTAPCFLTTLTNKIKAKTTYLNTIAKFSPLFALHGFRVPQQKVYDLLQLLPEVHNQIDHLKILVVQPHKPPAFA